MSTETLETKVRDFLAQKRIAIMMLADGETTAEQAIEKYKARAKKGVAMRGVK